MGGVGSSVLPEENRGEFCAGGVSVRTALSVHNTCVYTFANEGVYVSVRDGIMHDVAKFVLF